MTPVPHSPLFHFSQARLGAGSIIEPGNFGRLVKRYTPSATSFFGNGWTLSRELIFESVRPETKPSRLMSSFFLDSRDCADRYRQEHDRHYLQVLHEVELIDPTLPIHKGGLALLTMPNDVPFLDPTRLRAQQYWTGAGDPSADFEYISASALRVIRALE